MSARACQLSSMRPTSEPSRLGSSDRAISLAIIGAASRAWWLAPCERLSPPPRPSRRREGARAPCRLAACRRPCSRAERFSPSGPIPRFAFGCCRHSMSPWLCRLHGVLAVIGGLDRVVTVLCWHHIGPVLCRDGVGALLPRAELLAHCTLPLGLLLDTLGRNLLRR